MDLHRYTEQPERGRLKSGDFFFMLGGAGVAALFSLIYAWLIV